MKFAKNQLSILERQMSFQNLNEGNRTVKPFPGTVIECWSSFSLQQVNIYVAPVSVKPQAGLEIGKMVDEHEKRYMDYQRCLCLPHFSIGKVMEVTPPLPIRGIDPTSGQPFYEDDTSWDSRVGIYRDFLVDGEFVYDLHLCSNVSYVFYENMKSHGWGRYYKGQFVLVTVGSEMESWADTLDCDKNCLSKNPKFTTLAISSLHSNQKMEEWFLQTEIEQ